MVLTGVFFILMNGVPHCLAGIPNAPSAYSLDASPELAAQRQKQVLERMLRCDKITEEEVDSILAHNRVPVQEKIYLNAVIIKEN